jgi:hypothetical protein
MIAAFRLEEVKFMPEIHKIIKDNFMLFPQEISNVELSTDAEDTKDSFDLVYKSRIEVSIRIRNNYALQWCDFTIRSVSKWKNKCEIDKLIEGKGSIYLYAWKDETNSRLQTWTLVDINKIRGILEELRADTTLNKDGTGFIKIPFYLLRSYDAIINFYNIPPIIEMSFPSLITKG